MRMNRYRIYNVTAVLIFTLLVMCLGITLAGCSSGGGGSNSPGPVVSTTASFVGTQSPGDFWTWINDNSSMSFTASNNTQDVYYSGSVSSLTGTSSGFFKLNITSSNDGSISLPTSSLAYALTIPNTMVMSAVAPFYTLNHSGETQLSIHGPVVVAAQGSCPSSGTTTTVNWIVMPNDHWCPTDTASIATGTCTAADNAYGTAVITAGSGTTDTISVTPYHLDGSPGNPVSLTGCSCSEGVIQCVDSNSNPVRIAFTPSGVFTEDTASYGLVGVVQPTANIRISDLAASGNMFKGVVFDSWDDYLDGCHVDSDCSNPQNVSASGVSGGTCFSGHCGVPETQPIFVSADGSNLNAQTYIDIDTGEVNTAVSAVNLTGASSEPSPGLITTTLSSPTGPGCNIPGTFPFVMVATQINNKYVAFAITHSTCPTFDTSLNVLVIEQ